MGFTKLDNGISDSSIWDEESNVLKVFIAFWTKSNPEGYVQATYNAMFRAANLCDRNKQPLPISIFDETLSVLLSPDPKSRSKENEGRRIIRLEESLWLITNYKKIREYTYSDNPEAVRKRNYRKNGTKWDMSQSVLGHSASTSLSLSSLKEGEVQERGINQRNIIPPKIEWIEGYCKERGNNIDPQTFYDHYQARDWKPKGYTQRMKDWQAAIRTWERNETNKKPGMTNFLGGGGN